MSKFEYIENIINKLSGDKEYLLPVFLLRCSLVEYALKNFLVNYNYDHSEEMMSFVDGATIGAVINRLEQIQNDDYVTDILVKAKEFNKIRKAMVHHFLSSGDDIMAIENKLEETMRLTNKLEDDMIALLIFRDDFMK